MLESWPVGTRPRTAMKIKSYYARTVEDAMAAARQEMGSEAMLVNSRKTPVEARHLGEYEVVFATVGGSGTATEASLSLFGETAAAPSASAVRPALGGGRGTEAGAGGHATRHHAHRVRRRPSGWEYRRTSPMPMRR